MNKQKQGRKFGRKRDQRKALLKSLARALILSGKIETTEPKAKELRIFIEPLVTNAKIDTVHKRRIVARIMGSDQRVITKLFSEVGAKYKERNGGYTRIIKKTNRRGDDARMAVIEFV